MTGMGRGKYADLIKEGDDVLERMRIAMDVEMALVAAIRMRDVASLDSAIAKAEVGWMCALYISAALKNNMDCEQASAGVGSTANSLAAATKLRSELADQQSILEQLKVGECPHVERPYHIPNLISSCSGAK